MWDNFYNTKNYLEKKYIIKAKKKKILIENINILGNLSEKKCMSSEQCVGYALGRLYFHVHGNDENKKSVKKKKTENYFTLAAVCGSVIDSLLLILLSPLYDFQRTSCNNSVPFCFSSAPLGFRHNGFCVFHNGCVIICL